MIFELFYNLVYAHLLSSKYVAAHYLMTKRLIYILLLSVGEYYSRNF